jgi:hypothetical protein
MSWFAFVASAVLNVCLLGVIAYTRQARQLRVRLRKLVREWFGNFDLVVCQIVSAVIVALELAARVSPTVAGWAINDLVPGAILVVLAVFSIAILRDRRQRGELLDEIRLATEGSGDVRIYTSWNEQEVENLIASARDRLVIVDSWFDEAVPLAHLVSRAKRHAGQLKVDVYMADKDGDYGARRLQEIGIERLKYFEPQIVERMEKGDINAYKDAYAALFDAAVASLGIYFNDPDVDLTIYKHSLMPGLRLTVVDELKFIFSWFPLGSVSVKNVCFLLAADSISRRVRDAAEQLRGQLDQIRDANNSTQYDLLKNTGKEQSIVGSAPAATDRGH